jgi:hypothetical protein
VREHDRVVVDVDDAGVGGDALGDLVGVLGGGQARADVEVLARPRKARSARATSPMLGYMDVTWAPTCSSTS